MKILIPTTDFVLEQQKEAQEKGNLGQDSRIYAYANFVRQKLTLGMFVPCGEDGVFLKKPVRPAYTIHNYEFEVKKQDDYVKKYQQASEKVLFKGFYYDPVKNQLHKNVSIITLEPQPNVWDMFAYRDGKSLYTIEDLIKAFSTDIELTEVSLKQIGL